MDTVCAYLSALAMDVLSLSKMEGLWQSYVFLISITLSDIHLIAEISRVYRLLYYKQPFDSLQFVFVIANAVFEAWIRGW